MARHGRRNRHRIREGKRNLEMEERLRWQKNPPRDLLVMTGGHQDNPLLETLSYREIEKRCRHWRKRSGGRKPWMPKASVQRFQYNPHLQQVCWYSGVPIYLVTWEMREAGYTPWRCSPDHLVPDRNGGPGTPNNIVWTGRAMNTMLGHDPLPVKLHFRQAIQKTSFIKEPIWQTILHLRKVKHAIEKDLVLGEHFIYQNWTYKKGTLMRKKADAFADEMALQEQEYLSLTTDDERSKWIESFRWSW